VTFHNKFKGNRP